MQLKKKISDGIGFAQKEDYEYQGVKYEADLKVGDIIKILDSGVEEEGNFGLQNNFKIQTRNGEKKIALNQATINVLIDEFGGDTENWINKDVNVLLRKSVIGGKKCIVPYLVTNGWALDDYGELQKEGAQDVKGNNTPIQPKNDAQQQTTGNPAPSAPEDDWDLKLAKPEPVSVNPPIEEKAGPVEDVKVEDIPF